MTSTLTYSLAEQIVANGLGLNKSLQSVPTGMFNPNTSLGTEAKAVAPKHRKSDYADQENMKFPIATQAHVMSAARQLSRQGYDEAKAAAVKKRISKIAKRKGFDLPKAWAAEGLTKKAKESTATVSDQMVRDALRAALSMDDDPDGDGDDDTVENIWTYCYPVDVYDDWFVYSVSEDDGEDSGLYKRSYSIDANDQAVLGADIQRVVKRVSYDTYVGASEDSTESLKVTEGGLREGSTLTKYEAATDGKQGRISGTAIGPGVNRSGNRHYGKESLAKNVRHFAGKKMYLDHPSAADERNRPERSVRDIGAIVESAWTNGDGGIDYTAIVVNPELDAMLSLMSERGVLGHMGTSVNYRVFDENVAKIEVDGRRLDDIGEWEDLASLDFVTEAGAWGDVSRMESLAGIAPQEEENDVADDKVLEAMRETLATMQGELAASRKEAADERAERRKSDTRLAVKDLLAESALPEVAQARVAKQFEGAESVEGIADAIADMKTLVEGLTTKAVGGDAVATERAKIAAQRGVKRVVVGNGEGRSEADTPKVASVEEAVDSTDWLFGDKKEAKSFFEAAD